MGKSKLALGKGLKELLPENMAEVRESESLEELRGELERLEKRILTMGYSFPKISGVLKKKKATLKELKEVLEEGRKYLISLNRLETVLKQMEALGLTAQATTFKNKVSSGEDPQKIFELAEKELKKEVLKKSRKKARGAREEDLSEVQKMIDESREDIEAVSSKSAAEAGVEAIKKIEELSKSLDELSR
ncbi:MAG: hypothetical protein J7L88_05360, partial [Thermoplasmata archaeon]|nr:hypothetical protein [Thermoplasmata archaeon]